MIHDPLAEQEAFQEPSVVDAFLQHYDTPRGWMRTAIIQHFLEPVLASDHGLRIVDVGCGDARESIWLAAKGHSVLAVDPSEAMIERGRLLLAQVGTELAGSLEFHHGNEVSIQTELRPGSFDLVLSHGVLMYQSESSLFLSRHASLLRDGGHLSLLTRNALYMPLKAARDGNPGEALRYRSDRRSTGPMGHVTVSHSPEELFKLLSNVGLETTSWYGLRTFSDHLDDGATVTEDDLHRYLELELALSEVEPYRSVAPGIGVIARRVTDS